MKNPYEFELQTNGLYLGWVGVGHALQGTHARRRWLQHTGSKSYILIGAPRQGKYTTSIGYTELTYDGSLLVNSPKGESAYVSLPRRRAMGQKCLVLAPFYLPDTPQVSMATARYNPLKGEGFDPDHKEFTSNVGTLSGALILPDGGQSFFTDTAKELTSGVTAFACTLRPEERNLVTVFRILKSRGADFLRYIQNMDDCGVELARNAAAPYLVESPPRSVWDTLNTASVQVGELMEPDCIKYMLSGSDFEWSDLKKEKITIYICLPESQAKRYYRLTRLFFASGFQSLLTLPPAPIWFIMDELATSLGERSLDQVETALSLGPGYGLKLQCIFQSYSQAEHIWGKAKAQAMLGSAEIIQVFGSMDEATAQMVCSRAGQRTELALQGGMDATRPMRTDGGMQGAVNWTPGTHAIGVPIYRPQDIFGLPKDRSIIFKEGVSNPIEAFRTPYFEISTLAALGSENPYAPKQSAPVAPKPSPGAGPVRGGGRSFWHDMASGAWVKKG
jgi:type IV secretion system protein VirD4